MSNVFIDFAGIFHVKDDLFRFIDTMEDHQKVLIFTINSENDFKNVLRIETSGIQKLLMQIGIPANMLGFSYIVTALELIALDPDYLNNITKGLYVDVAKKCSSTAARVERNIRHAIEIAWDRGNLDTLNSFFGYTVNTCKGKPTNSEFIALITDKLRLQYRSNSSKRRHA